MSGFDVEKLARALGYQPPTLRERAWGVVAMTTRVLLVAVLAPPALVLLTVVGLAVLPLALCTMAVGGALSASDEIATVFGWDGDEDE